MKTTRTKDTIHVELEGAIGESTPLFILPIKDMKEMSVDFTNATYINSIGVKHWVNWSMKLPKGLSIKLINCPFVIVSQASIVVGFTTPQMTIESFRMPYVCGACTREITLSAARGKDYDYTTPEKPKWVKLEQNVTCPKCGTGKLEPDFFIEKTFKFLR